MTKLAGWATLSVLAACASPAPDADLVRGQARYSGGELVAPGAEIVTGGAVYPERAELPGDTLAGVVLDGEAYLVFTGWAGAVALSHDGSRAAVADFALRRGTGALGRGRQAPFHTPTGLVVALTDDGDLAVDNTAYRWALVTAAGGEQDFLTPVSLFDLNLVSALWEDGVIQVNAGDRAVIPLAPPVRTYGSVVRVWALPGPQRAAFNAELEAGYRSDPERVARLNAVELLTLIFDGIGALVGLVPAGDCIELAIAPIVDTFEIFGLALLVGDDDAVLDAAGEAIDGHLVDIGVCLADVSGVGTVAGLAAGELLGVIGALGFVGEAAIGADQSANLSSYYELDACEVTGGDGDALPLVNPCGVSVPGWYPTPHFFVAGVDLQAAAGDLSCTSDVLPYPAIRISPGGGPGLAEFRFAPGEAGQTADISIDWLDNAWWSADKALEIYDHEAGAWERVATWSGNDGIEHIDDFTVTLEPRHVGPCGVVRIGVWADADAVIHLASLGFAAW